VTRRGRASGASPTGAEQRSLLSQVVRYFLDPLVYYFNLQGSDGRPSHSKIFGAIAFFFGLPMIWLMFQTHVEGKQAAMKLAQLGIAAPTNGAELTFIISFTTLVFGAPFGLAFYRIYLSSKTATAQAQALGQAAVAGAQASAEISRAVTERRQLGEGEYEVT
jgi:hypothetical protein